MTKRERVGVVVDAYSTGRWLAPRFAAEGVPCVHVQSAAEPPQFYAKTFQPQDFRENVVFDGSVARVLERLSSWDVAFVVAGAETGVPLSDALSEALTPSATNGTALSTARRDKHEMANALRRAGLRAVEERKTGDVAEAVAWAAARDDWPVVVKPLDSAGTDGVHFCADEDELRESFTLLLEHPNALRGANHELLVQEQLRGREFIVNSVSCDGVHHISEIWHVVKRLLPGASVIYDYEDLLPARGPEQDVLMPYVRGILDALGIRFGAAHTELVLDESGPVMVETGARMQGTMLAEPIERCTPSHITVTAEAYLDPGSVARRAAAPYELRSHSRCLALISDHDGLIVSADGLREIERLPSYAASLATLGPGDLLRRTVDLFSSPGTIYLVHPEVEQLRTDYERLRELERAGLYEVEEPVAR
jgi:biotin carboxylase